jgi:hypothetical protein
MFGFGTASRKAFPPAERGKVVGLDVTATRLQAVSALGTQQRILPLSADGDDLPLVLHLDRRVPEVGRAGLAECRKSPHLVATGFLPQLGQARLWQSGRTKVTPESALGHVLDALQLVMQTEAIAAVELALPTYLTRAQIPLLLNEATKAKLPVRGTAAAALTVVAHRANLVQQPQALNSPERADWIVPMPRAHDGPISVVVVDADDFALTASVVSLEAEAVKLVASGAWVRASYKLWKDRMLDAMADRCVRLCRRDPRDSAEAEQALYDQLEPALDRIRLGLPVALTVRSEHWYQDLVHQPEEFDGFCTPLAKHAAEGIRGMIAEADLERPPLAVWLTHNAARLPALAAAIHRSSSETTNVLALPAHAIAEAAAALAHRRQAGEVGTGHLDTIIPWGNPVAKATTRTSQRGVTG